ncbi:MAG: fibronectin type III domain-containing protein, partial [Micrococcales bacterium]|nr:fibronectin type III domain-containing protein [Micrococcales bacterium]
DGDGVLLQGLDSVPLKGRIIEVGADFFWYEAFPGEVGTDAFTYAVEDWVGLRAVAQIKVAVAERPTGLGGVVARDDDLLVRPGEQLQARVLANDLDMAGGSLSLCGQPVGSAPGLKPSYAGSRLVVDAPAKAGTVQFEYTACNSRGDQDRATLRVRVDPKAPIQAPRAGDVVVSPADSINRSSVDIDVMALADNPSGPLSDLEVSLPPAGQDLAVVTSQSKLRVKLQNEPTIVFYQLTNRRPEAGGSHAFGYVSVPALGTFPPVLRPGEDVITAIAGQPTELALARYVMVGPGKQAYLAQPDAIGAAKSDGSRPYLDNQTLLYSAASNYAGPASITFKVADSADLTSAETRLAVLTLPITVKPAGQVRPAFTPPSLEVERAGVPKAVDLTNFVTVLGAPVPPGTLTTKLSGWTGGGIDVSLNGTVLTVSAANDVPTGWRGAIGLMIGYETSPPIRVSVEVQVTAPTRRLTALVRLPRQVLSQGQAQMVEVLAGAWNPAPEIGGLTLRQVSVNPPGAGSAAIVGSSVQVTPADGFLGEMSINFTVNDALAEPNREVTGSFAATVRGRPNAPGPPRAGLPADGQLPLVFDPPKDNGAAIIDYRVSWGSGSQLCFQSSCTITSLTNGQTYSFAVQARNEVGLSARSAYSPAVLVDLVPLAPRNLAVQRGNQKLTVSWAAPPKHGSAVTKYLVTLTGGAVVSVETAATTYVFTDLEAGREYNLAVRAQNNHPEPSPPAQGTAVPFGDPDRPTITVTRLDASTLSAAVPPVQGHGSPPEYRVRYRAGGGRTQAICGSGGAITACNIPTQPGVTYEVWAEVKNETDNWIASASQMVTQYSRPVISQVKLSPGAGLSDQDGGHIDVVFSGSAQPNSLIFTISLSNGSSQTVTGAGSVGFSDLKAGTYTATVTACHQTLAGMSSGAAEACSVPVTSASLTVVTRSAEPASSPGVRLGGPGGPATTAAMLAAPDRGGGDSTPSLGLDPAIRRTQWI